MADPTKYQPGYSYTAFEASNPTTPKPGAQLDNDYANIALSISQSVDAIEDVRRSDGALNNGIVTKDSLAQDALALIAGGGTPRGAWVANTAYAIKDLVSEGGVTYICPLAHTSSTNFATDLAAGDWMIFSVGADSGDMPYFEYFSGTGASQTITLGQSFGTSDLAIEVYAKNSTTANFERVDPANYTLNGNQLSGTFPSGSRTVLVFAPSTAVAAAVNTATTSATTATTEATTATTAATSASASATAAASSAALAAASAVVVVSTMAALKALSLATLQNSARIDLLGYYAANDGGGGQFYWNSGDTRADDTGCIIQPTVVSSGPGRVNRLFGNRTPYLHSSWYGVKADNSTDNMTALQTLVNAASTLGALGVYIDPCPGSSINFSNSITLANGLVVQGAGRDISNLKCTAVGLTTFAFKLLQPIGGAYVNGPRVYDLSLTCQSGIQLNSIAGGFTDDNTSQGAMGGPHVMRCGLYCVSNNTPGPIGVQISKCTEALVENCVMTGFATMVDFEGCENSRIRDNRMDGATSQFILANYQNTFGNNLVIDGNFMAEMVTGGNAFIVSSQKTVTITNNWMEGAGTYTAIIWLKQTQNGMAVIENNWGSFGTNFASCFFKVDDTTDGTGAGVGTGYITIEFNNNANGGLIGANGEASFNSGAGISYFTSAAAIRRKIIHQGNQNNWAEVGFPMNSRDSSIDSFPFMPWGIACFSPNDDGLNSGGYGPQVKCKQGAFALALTGSTNYLDFGNTDKTAPTGNINLFVLASSASSGVLSAAVTDAGSVVGSFTNVTLTPAPKWYSIVTEVATTTRAGCRLYGNSSDILVYAAALTDS